MEEVKHTTEDKKKARKAREKSENIIIKELTNSNIV